MRRRYLSPEKEARFPRLKRNDYFVTSDEDGNYNCIAWAVGITDVPWWPVPEGTQGVDWPAGVPREETLEAFIAAYRTRDFHPSDDDDASVENGIEKIAVFVDADGSPSHAARQLPSGSWTSKLGDWEDIEHKKLSNLEGQELGEPAYGRVAKILKRHLDPK
jgi:hypothetical protein